VSNHWTHLSEWVFLSLFAGMMVSFCQPQMITLLGSLHTNQH